MTPFATVMLTAMAAADHSPTSLRGPYCGVACVFAAADRLGKPIAFNTLLRAEFVGGYNGSSGQELVAAASAAGLHGKALERLGIAALYEADAPLILHLSVKAANRGLQHWVLFLGWDGDAPRVLDPGDPERQWSLPELLSDWDGAAIAISLEPIRWRPAVTAYLRWSALAAALATALLFLASHLFPHGGRRIVDLAALAMVAMASAVSWDSVIGQDLLLPSELEDVVAAEYAPPPIADAPLADVERAVEAQNALIVDARLERDFATGSLPGATNLPIDLLRSRWTRRTAAFDKTRPVIVFCQSKDCTWAAHVGRMLIARGFRDVRRFPGGYEEWQATHARRR